VRVGSLGGRLPGGKDVDVSSTSEYSTVTNVDDGFAVLDVIAFRTSWPH
jgi:hypothetical protein